VDSAVEETEPRFFAKNLERSSVGRWAWTESALMSCLQQRGGNMVESVIDSSKSLRCNCGSIDVQRKLSPHRSRLLTLDKPCR
jgi:hypothetical protein